MSVSYQRVSVKNFKRDANHWFWQQSNEKSVLRFEPERNTRKEDSDDAAKRRDEISRIGETTTKTVCKNYGLTIQYSKIRDAGCLVLERSD